MSKVTISVVTITLNNASGLRKTLESLKNQTRKPSEVIVIDGGSRDESMRVLHDFEPIIHQWVSEKDAGIYDAMNKGVRLANSEYILFMNGGDCFRAPASLAFIFEALSERGADVLYGNFEVDYGNKIRLQKARSIDHLWKGMITCHQAMVVRRAWLQRHAFDLRYKTSADFELIYWMQREGASFASIDSALACVEAGGLSHRHYSRVLKENLSIIWRHLPGTAKLQALCHFLPRILAQWIVEITYNRIRKPSRS